MIRRVLKIEVFEELDGEVSCLLTEDEIHNIETRIALNRAVGEFEKKIMKIVGKE